MTFNAFPIATTELIRPSGTTTARNLKDKLAEVLSVRDFGADPTGVADSASAFRLALAEAITTASEAQGAIGAVFVPRGRYKINSAITLPPNGIAQNSFTIYGESSGASQIFSSFNGFVFDTGGNTTGISGGYIFEKLSVTNTNTTQYTSGCFRLGGAQNSIVRSCGGSGQVWVTFEYPVGTRLAQGSGIVENCMVAGDGTSTCIGIVAAGDNMMVSHCILTNWGVAIALAGFNPVVLCCHFEINGTAIAVGMNGDGTSDACGAYSIISTTYEANGTGIDIIGGSAGVIMSWGMLLHNSATIGGVAPGICNYGLRIRDTTMHQTTIENGGTSGTSTVAHISVGNPVGGAYLRPLNVFKGIIAQATSGTGWVLPGSGTGGAAAADAANCAVFEQCNISPVWKYDDLPWDTLTSATITGTSLVYASASRGLGPILGGLITGVGVTAGTIISLNGTTFFGATLDNGSGAAGTVLNFTSYDGVDPITDADIGGSNSQAVCFQSYIDNGSGSAGHVLTTPATTITSASISGTTLTFSLVNVSGPGATSSINNMKVIGAGVSANTFVISGSGTTWTLNKSHTFGPGTLTLVPDVRVGYEVLEAGNTGASTSWVVTSQSTDTTYQLTGASDQLTAPALMVWWQEVALGTKLTTQNSATSWNVSGSNQNLGYSGDSGYSAVNTWKVNNSQTVGPVSMKAYSCLAGDEFMINDSGTAAASNFAASVTAGGGSNTVKLRMDGKTGFIIV